MDTKIKKEISKCDLCHLPPCSTVRRDLDVGRMMRALYFDNVDLAASLLPNHLEGFDLTNVEGVCPEKIDIGRIVREISRLLPKLEGVADMEQIDLSCDLCGVKLDNPFLLSSSVVASNYEMCARAFEMGWAGACFKTISLIEMHEAAPRFSAEKFIDGKWYGFKNIEQLSDHSLEENMACLRMLKEAFPDKVLIASIMGRNEAEWEYLAKKVTDARADVIECNFSCPNMEEKGTGSDIGEDPDAVKRFTAAARRGSSLPILAKMTPNITDMRLPALAAIQGGADGIAAINTIKSITGVNIDTLVALPSVHGHSMLGGYSGAAVKPIALRFITELAQTEGIIGHHISGMGGVQTWRDALEFMLLGAGSIQVTTAVMEFGYRIIDDLIAGLKIYMAQRGYTSVSQFIGTAVSSVVDKDELERDTIVYPKIDRQSCTGCGRCYVSCRDGGHQALVFQEGTRMVKLNGRKCVGCLLCALVCPEGAIRQSKRIQKRPQSA